MTGRQLVSVNPARLRAFISQVDTTGGQDACWSWRGSMTREGYGRIGQDDAGVHRVAYELMVQPIPDGLVIDHACHNRDLTCTGGKTCKHRRCVNPNHLRPVRQSQNLRDSPLTQANRNAAKTHCPRNHEYSPENTRVRVGKTGPRRDCRTCTREQNAKRRKRIALAAGETP